MPYLSLRAGGGPVVLEHGFHGAAPDAPLLRRTLAPGSYLIVAWQRPCEGSCDQVDRLDAPTDRCRLRARLRPGATLALRVRLRPGRAARSSPTCDGAERASRRLWPR